MPSILPFSYTGTMSYMFRLIQKSTSFESPNSMNLRADYEFNMALFTIVWLQEDI